MKKEDLPDINTKEGQNILIHTGLTPEKIEYLKNVLDNFEIKAIYAKEEKETDTNNDN